MNKIGLKCIKAVALAADDLKRAARFYGETLGLEAVEDGDEIGFLLGEDILLLKDEWYGFPTQEPNPRITLEVEDATATEAALRALGITISDPVRRYGDHPVGSFLDSEGNKLWFCSET